MDCGDKTCLIIIQKMNKVIVNKASFWEEIKMVVLKRSVFE
jgi:hypothetical protein